MTEIKQYKSSNAEVYRNVYNKQKTGKISRIYEDKQKHNTNAKKKTEGDLEKELEEMINDYEQK